MLTSILLLVLLGLFTGFFAGLLGIGGGAIMVPALTSFFLWQQHDSGLVVHMALATSMSCIIINAIISVKTHQKHQAVIWPVVYQMSPPVLIGSSAATYFVLSLNSKSIALIFMLLMLLIAFHMILGYQPKVKAASKIKTIELIPVGLLVGLVSAIIAIGGGSLTVPYLTWHQINIRKAIATASAIGLPIAIASCLVYLVKGNQQDNLPEQTLGYIYWPATLIISMGSLLTTPVGARLTHRLPVNILKVIFALLIIILAIKMFLSFH